MGTAFTPLTTNGIAGVAPEDAGAASGVVNAAQQLGSSLGLSVLITVFASASRSAAHHPLPGVSAQTQAHYALTHAVSSAITGSALLLGLAFALSLLVAVRPPTEGDGARVHRGGARMRTRAHTRRETPRRRRDHGDRDPRRRRAGGDGRRSGSGDSSCSNPRSRRAGPRIRPIWCPRARRHISSWTESIGP